jgi:HPt (histidine-containing phosphotransfer) domain-containing protein
LVGQEEEFTQNGFDDFISKPVNSGRLHEVLVKFISSKQSPETLAAAQAKSDEFLKDNALLDNLQKAFITNHRNAAAQISQSLSTNDPETAHRTAHTLKSSAMLIHETHLAKLAGDIEDTLRDKKSLENSALPALEAELTRVLESIKTPENQPSENPPPENLTELFDKLEPLIKSRNPDTQELLGELNAIPQAAILAKQIEDYDFAPAAKSLEALRKLLGN